MKSIKYMLILSLATFMGCDNELNIEPQGVLTNDLITNDFEYTNSILTGAYSALDGNFNGVDPWRAAASNWVYGEVASDNAYKGSFLGDQDQIDAIESYEANGNGDFMDYKYQAIYTGVAKANNVILAAEDGFADGDISQDDYNRLIGEARFLRGHFHFEAKKMWNKIAYIDETITESIPNTTDDSVWDSIELDFQEAINLLDETSVDVGRANSWMARAYLAKAHMYQADFDFAKPLLDDIINEGPYSLNARFSDNFNGANNNSVESIFAVQFSVNDGTPGENNGNWGEALNYPQTGAAGAASCCGFFQPSINLANAFKTDADGLPLLDTFNDEDILNEETQFRAYVAENGSEEGYDETFELEQGNLDPRLDRTIGRRGIDYNGFGIHPGRSWIRDFQNGGPYLGKKNHIQADQLGVVNSTSAWTGNINGINVNIIRFAEVLLWRAEIAASEGDLAIAVQYVDMVRARAANPDDFVLDSDTELPSSNYVIGEYGSFMNQEQAIKAVEHEQRIELAMEGHRFFELVRKGIAQEVLNEYIAGEDDNRLYLVGATFSAEDQYYPFPQSVIIQSGGVLTQN